MAKTVKEIGLERAREILPDDPNLWLSRALRQYDKGRYRSAAAAAAIATALFARDSA